MNRLFLTLIYCLLSSFAIAQHDMWYWRDGEFYKGETVDSITFVKPGAGGHEVVDMGLSVRWAACNVGAAAAWEAGDYFAWGETEGYAGGKRKFYWSDYKWGTGVDAITKYCTVETDGSVDSMTQLKGCDDAARRNMGGAWRMPTETEMRELLDNCYWQWTDDYGACLPAGRVPFGVAGFIVYKAKASSDKGLKQYPEGHFLYCELSLSAEYTIDDTHLFLPTAGGIYFDGKIRRSGEDLLYWTSSLHVKDNKFAWALSFSSSDLNMLGWDRTSGFTVRAVLQE